jgi:mycothiol synthase
VANEGRKVEAWSHADHPAAAKIAEAFGVARERELKIMQRSLVGELPPVRVPDGVRIRTFEPDDEPALLEVNATAFAHHPEQGHMTHEDFQDRTRESWFDAAGLFLAVPDEGGSGPGLLGFHWTKVHTAEDPPYGEVYVVAVNPKAAGRGLGTVLTAAGLEHLRDQGLESVLLYVDGDNDPAIAVYTNLGFHVKRTEVQYRGTPVLTTP